MAILGSNTKTYAISGGEYKDITGDKTVDLQIISDRHTPVSYYVGQDNLCKSLQMHKDLRDFCANSYFKNLPFITLIHHNDTTDAFISELRTVLPTDSDTKIGSIKLINDKDHAINIFDVQVGLPKPMRSEDRQMTAFLVRLLTPSEQTCATVGMNALANQLIHDVFKMVIGKDATQPKYYAKGISHKVDELVSKYELVGAGYNNTFFELANRLQFVSANYADGSIEQAEIMLARDQAHYLSMPVMSDLLVVLDSPELVDSYSDKLNTAGEAIIAFAKRTIERAVTDYPSLSNHTTLSRGDMRVLAIDLGLVVEAGNHRQNSLFLQAARAFALREIYIIPSDLTYGGAESVYDNYYHKKLTALNNCDKLIAIDGILRLESDLDLAGLLVFDMREFRKLGINIAITSENLTDLGVYENDSRVDIMKYVRKLFVFTKPDSEDIRVLERCLTGTTDILHDLTKINESTYFACEVFSAVHISSVIKTALNPK